MTFDNPHITLTDEEAEAVRHRLHKYAGSSDPALAVAVRAEMAAREFVKHCVEIYRDMRAIEAAAKEL